MITSRRACFEGGHPCHYCSPSEIVSALFLLFSWSGDLGCAQNVPLPCILAPQPPEQGEAVPLAPSSEEASGFAVVCDQGEELVLCDLDIEDGFAVMVASQTALSGNQLPLL